jgi:hypothetical protein
LENSPKTNLLLVQRLIRTHDQVDHSLTRRPFS